VKACHEALCSWSDQVELPVVTPEVRAMIALAEESGAVAKVSGAGGGDSVLAFSDDASVLTRVRTGWLEAGFEPLPIQRCEWGVREVS
jgi:phosphomevalonate kinase